MKLIPLLLLALTGCASVTCREGATPVTVDGAIQMCRSEVISEVIYASRPIRPILNGTPE
jgi:hypothetical protein